MLNGLESCIARLTREGYKRGHIPLVYGIFSFSFAIVKECDSIINTLTMRCSVCNYYSWSYFIAFGEIFISFHIARAFLHNTACNRGRSVPKRHGRVQCRHGGIYSSFVFFLCCSLVGTPSFLRCFPYRSVTLQGDKL